MAADAHSVELRLLRRKQREVGCAVQVPHPEGGLSEQKELEQSFKYIQFPPLKPCILRIWEVLSTSRCQTLATASCKSIELDGMMFPPAVKRTCRTPTLDSGGSIQNIEQWTCALDLWVILAFSCIPYRTAVLT